jgi:hypothetical protein
MRVKSRHDAQQTGNRLPALQVPEQPQVEPERKVDRQTAQDYWRTHTWINGYEQELDVGMVEHVTDKGRLIRYSVGHIK